MCVYVCVCVYMSIVYVDVEGSRTPGICLSGDLYVHNKAVCSGCTYHMQMACDILPPTEVQDTKHRCDYETHALCM